MPEPSRARVAAAKRIVVKVGTNVVMRDDGALALGRIYSLIESVAGLVRAGREVLLVSSGAVGLGAQKLGLAERPKTLAKKQACAAIGQGRLMAVYEEGFERLGLVTAQVLLTEDDFTDRARYLNLRATLGELLALRAVPVLNENDTVSTQELESRDEASGGRRVFGDNDKLSALVASKMSAELLVLLSDVDGLYTANPRKSHSAERIAVVPELTPDVQALADGGGTRGRGGMATKLQAAAIATRSGAVAVIADGRRPGILDEVVAGADVGTVFLPKAGLAGKRRWIAYASSAAGSLYVNDGARTALLKRKASLLPAGVVRLEGEFERGDVVSIRDEAGVEIARGVANYSSADAGKLVGQRSEAIARLVGKKRDDDLVTRDNIVIV